MHGGSCPPTTESQTCPVVPCPIYAVKTCLAQTDGDPCVTNGYFQGQGGCYTFTNMNELPTLSDDQETAKDQIGYQTFYEKDNSNSQVGVRCFNETGNHMSFDLNKTYNEAVSICESEGMRLPKTLHELGATCGSGNDLDYKFVWMDACVGTGQNPSCSILTDEEPPESAVTPPPEEQEQPADETTPGGHYVAKNCRWGGGGYVNITQSDAIQYTPEWIDTQYNREQVHGWAQMESQYDTNVAKGVAVRCHPKTSIGGYLDTGISWQAAKNACNSQGKDLPKTLAELGQACGSGESYDARLIWMHEDFDQSDIP